MGFFDDLDVASAEIIPDGLPADTYAMIVSNAEVKPTSAGTMMGLGITYTVITGKFKGRTFFEWQRVPHKSDIATQTEEHKEKNLSYLKTRMLSLGIPESRVNEAGPEDVIGTEVIVELYMSKATEKYPAQLRINKVKLGTITEDELAAMPGNTSQMKSNPFA